ncbi:hypothetical protein DFH06DRAFT_1369798 [Mycena polygramma]|nr:hypothetical protein DFH06DRAFT_1369798 [Mycena polygramma]
MTTHRTLVQPWSWTSICVGEKTCGMRNARPLTLIAVNCVTRTAWEAVTRIWSPREDMRSRRSHREENQDILRLRRIEGVVNAQPWACNDYDLGAIERQSRSYDVHKEGWSSDGIMVDSASSGVRQSGRSSAYLHKACMNCRQRKIRCDGERPVCRRCRLQPPRSLNPCKYSHAPVGGGSSQEMVAAEQGINELEQDPSTIFLSDPYSSRGGEPDDSTVVGENPLDTLSSAIEVSVFVVLAMLCTEHFQGATRVDHRVVRDVFPVMRPLLTGTTPRMDIFCHHFAGCPLFFLDPAPFQQSALGRPDLLPRGLLNAVSLWATRLAPLVNVESTYSEEALLGRTVYHLARDIATVDGPRNHQLILLIQAEVLLPLYYLDAGNLLQGDYHRVGATSLAFTAGLHVPPSQTSQPSQLLSNTLPESVDMDRRKELVGGFWSIVILNNYFVAASGVPSSVPCDILTARWRTDIVPGSVSSSDPFFDGNDVHNHSPQTMYIKASILLACAIPFATRNPGSPKFTVMFPDLPHPPEFWTMDRRLEIFRSQILPMDATAPTDGLVLVTDVLVNAAILRLHAPFSATDEASRFKCLTATSCVAGRLIDARITEWDHADPILGSLLAAFVDVLVPILPFGAPAEENLQTILSAMHTLAQFSPLIQQCLEALQGRYVAVQQTFGASAPAL